MLPYEYLHYVTSSNFKQQLVVILLTNFEHPVAYTSTTTGSKVLDKYR